MTETKKTIPKEEKPSVSEAVRIDYWAVVLLLWLCSTIIGIVLYTFLPDFLPVVSFSIFTLVGLSLAVAFSSVLFFGRAGPLSVGLAAVLVSSQLSSNALFVLFSFFPLAVSSASGTILGHKLRDDFKGLDNWRDYSRDIVLYLGVGLILAIIAGFLAPALPMVPFSLADVRF